jgi:hypothetical protein
MSVDKTKVLTGECTISLGGVALGLTTEDGISFGTEKTWIDVKGDQAVVTVLKRLTHVKRTIAFTLLEITKDAIGHMGGFTHEVSNKVKYSHTPEELVLIITGPAGGVVPTIFTYTTTVVSAEVGNVVRTKTGAVGIPVTFEEIGDPAINAFGTYVET